MVKPRLAVAITGLALLMKELTMTNEYAEKLPEVVTEYINAVVKQIKYRKSVRAEVRQELEAHFADALHGCESEDERQKRARALIAGFGEVKLLAKLIRRGKKRCRPLWRTLVVRAFQLVGVLFLLLLLYIGWFFSGKPIITTNYLEVLNTQVRPAADESLNARHLYEQAINAYVAPQHVQSPDGPPQEFDTSPRKYSSLSPQERQVMEQWLSGNQKTIELIRQGNQLPHYWWMYATAADSSELVSIYFPHLQEFRRIARLLCWNAVAEAEQGHFEQAIDSLIECYSLGQHLNVKGTLIEQLVAIAIQRISMETTRRILHEHASVIETSPLAQVRVRLEQMLGKDGFVVGFEAEKLCVYDEIQRSFTQSRIGRSHVYIPRLEQLVGQPDEYEWLGQWFTLLFTHPDREETLESAERFYAEIQKYAEYTPATLRSKGIDIEQQVQKTVRGNLLLAMLTPALERALQIAYGNRADSEATLTVLAILQYRKQHDKLPDSLETLVDSGLLKEVPIDPFSDEPLVYRRLDDTFTLYSVGLNFEDDAGLPAKDDDGRIQKWADKGDTIFWPPNLD